MLMLMKHAIIGSGPCGALAALLLLRKGHQVALFDVDSDASLSESNLASSLKLVNGSSAPYDIQQILKIQNKGAAADFYRSKVMGGFSNVWGATWGPQESLDSLEWQKHHEVVTDILKEDGFFSVEPNRNCTCLDFLSTQVFPSGFSTEFRGSRTPLAVNPTVCECIDLGRTACTHGSIWSSKLIIEKCKRNEGFEYHSGRDVTKVKNEAGQLVVSGKEFEFRFESVILAAGTVGTVEILSNSLPNRPEITVQDTLMGYIPLLRFRLRKNHVGAFAFSQYRFDFHFGKESLAAHTQLYADSEIYLDRMIGKIPSLLRVVFAPIVNFLTNHLAIGIIYLDAKASPKLTFNATGAPREMNTTFHKPLVGKTGLLRQLWRLYRTLGFLPLLPAIAWSGPGESYHLGAMEEGIVDEFGSVEEMNGLHLAGSIALPKLEPGPITHSAMAQTSRLVERILYQNLERT
jgi:hypothetical protein